MKPEELRKGNIIKVIGRNPTTVETISSSGINKWQDMGMSGEIKFEELTGIALTEALLIKIGFEKHTMLKNQWLTFYISKEDGIGLFLSIKDMLIYYSNDPIHHIKYVHQLQNLYFSLTGKELTIKL